MESRSLPKQDTYNQQFQQRQTEYKSMFDKQPPPEPIFQDKFGDTAIPNMDELVRNHIQQREAELRKYSPPTLTIDANTNNNISFIPDQVIEQPKKTVSWAPDYKEEVQLELNSLRTMVMTLLTKVSVLEQQFTALHLCTLQTPPSGAVMSDRGEPVDVARPTDLSLEPPHINQHF